mgnify:CR=1 FL=1
MEFPNRRYSPRALKGTTGCDSRTDSKVWMEEVDSKALSTGFFYGGTKMGNKRSTKYLIQVAILGAIAGILMIPELPIAFVAPTFYKLDLSEVAVLIGTFSLGPGAGAMIEVIKILINLMVNGTETAYVGELGNLIIGLAFVVPAGFVYKHNKTKKNAIVSLAVGGLMMVLFASIINYFVLIPAYSFAFGIDIDYIVSLGHAINENVNGLLGFILVCVIPFNLIKAIVVSLIVFLVYKRISPLLKVSG